MGEYATRLRDGAEIKIGTCNSMYYCRYDQLNQINYGYNTDNLLWRIPAIEEDNVEVGEFVFGGLYKDGFPLHSLRLWDIPKDSELMGLADNVGTFQLHSEKLGMLLNVPCHHGLKLPEDTGSIKAFFNGHRNPLHLCFLKNTDKELRVGIKCAACGEMWSLSFDEIEPYMVSEEMKLRLLEMCSEYYFEHTGECAKYSVTEKNERDRSVSIYPVGAHTYGVVYDGGDPIVSGYKEAVKNFMYYLRYADRQEKGGVE